MSYDLDWYDLNHPEQICFRCRMINRPDEKPTSCKLDNTLPACEVKREAYDNVVRFHEDLEILDLHVDNEDIELRGGS